MTRLKVLDSWGYEVSLIFGGTLLILILQFFTGHLFTWMLWVLSAIIVMLSYVDHVCVGWKKLTWPCQWRRILCDGLTSGITLTLLYWSLYFILPRNLNLRKVSAVLAEVQKFIRLHNYFGFFVYNYLYVLFYAGILAGLRVFVNFLYSIYMFLNDVYGISTEQPRNHPPPLPTVRSEPVVNNDRPHTE